MKKKNKNEVTNDGIAIEKPELGSEIATLSKRGEDLSFGSILPTPDKIFKKLGKQQQNVYSQLLTDPYLQGLIQSRKAGTLQLEYEVKGNDAPENVINAVWEMLERIDIYDLTNSILDAVLYGYQPIELYWENINNETVPVKAIAKPFHWFGYNKDYQLVYKEDDYDEDGTIVTQTNFLVPRNNPSYANPYGVPLLSYCYWNIFFKTKGFEFWAEFAEKFGSPNILLKYRNDADEDKLLEFYESLVNMQSNGVITVPEKYQPEILNGATSSSINIFQSLIDKAKQEVEILILGHESSASSEAGRLGNNQQTLDVNERIINTDKRLVAKTINQLIEFFVRLNFNNVEYCPEFTYKQSEDLQLERVERDNKMLLLNRNVKFSKQYLVDMYNIDEKYLEEVEGTGISPVGKSNSTMLATLDGKHKPYFQRTVFMADEFEDQDLADKFIDKVLLKQNNDKLMGEWIDEIHSFATRYDDLNTLLSNYHKIYNKIDSNGFSDIIARAVTVIRLLGWHYSAEEIENIEQYGFTKIIPTMRTSIKLKDLEFAFGESPEDAVKYFKEKGFKVSKNFKEYIKAIKEHAFTVAGVTKMGILKDFKDLVLKGLENELSISEFRREMKSRLAEYGWQDTKVNSNYRLNNIYRTNIQESLNVARTQQMQSVKTTFPFIQNISILDKVTTPECDYLNGKVFSQDDNGFFSDYAPMGHFGCRRRIRALTQRMFDAIKSRLYKSDMRTVMKYKNQKGFTGKNKPFKPNLDDFPKELANEFKKAQ